MDTFGRVCGREAPAPATPTGQLGSLRGQDRTYGDSVSLPRFTRLPQVKNCVVTSRVRGSTWLSAPPLGRPRRCQSSKLDWKTCSDSRSDVCDNKKRYGPHIVIPPTPMLKASLHLISLPHRGAICYRLDEHYRELFTLWVKQDWSTQTLTVATFSCTLPHVIWAKRAQLRNLLR